MPEVLLQIDEAHDFSEFYELIQSMNYVKQKKIRFAANSTLADILAYFPVDKLWTYEEVCAVFPPESRLEIINQKIQLMPAPSIKHQSILKKLVREMDTFVEANNSGTLFFAPVDVKLDEKNVVQPDVIFVSDLSKIKENYIEGAPDLAVEVYSKNKMQESKKKELYAKSGVAEYWAVEPEKESVTVNILEKHRYEIFSKAQKEGSVISKVLGGFKLNIKGLF